MKLVVLGTPKMSEPAVAQQKTVVTYDPGRALTIIDCDVDIVTLGLAVNVLTEQYEQYLTKLTPDVAERIRITTRKAVQAYAEN